jgi:hypothetical protein
MGTVLTASLPEFKGFYVGAITDVPGVVAANNFMCFFVPATATIAHVSFEVIVQPYSVGMSSTPNSMVVQRVTSCSGGTLQAASTTGRFLTTMPDPQSQIFTNNPTCTVTGPNLAAFPPPISNGVGSGSTSSQTVVPGASFTMLPGQGLLFRTAAGNTNQMWNIEYVWGEF